jgi:hypothetical protein
MTDNATTPLPHAASVIFAWVWDALPYSLMRSRVVEISDIFANDPMKVAFIQDQHVIQAFPPHAANEPLTYGVRLGGSHRYPQHSYPTISCHTVETLPVLAIVVSYQKSRPFLIRRRFSHLLCYPEVTR